MIVIDVNVLVYAFREDTPQHAKCYAWLAELLVGSEPFVVPDSVRYGFVRVVTSVGIFRIAAPVQEAAAFIDGIIASTPYRPMGTSEAHWSTFKRLCDAYAVRGNLVPDAYLAALTLVADAVLATCDRGFRRFTGLRLVDPAA